MILAIIISAIAAAIFIYLYIFNHFLFISPLKYRNYFQEDYEINNVQEEINDLIFVSIASYRDPDCKNTIKDLIEKADFKDKLRIVVFQQNKHSDQNCNDNIEFEHLKVIKVPHTLAKGPMWARYNIQQYYNGEQYFFQIDSHTRLIQSWDTKLKQLSIKYGPNTVITQYPLEFNYKSDKDLWKIKQNKRGPMYVEYKDKYGILRYTSDYVSDDFDNNKDSVGWAAGFVFHRGSFIEKVPLDPYMFTFFGEQMEMAIRAYTHGYDLKVPDENMAYHIYNRSYRKTWWELKHQKNLEFLSNYRLFVKLNLIPKEKIPKRFHFILNDIELFGLGTERSVKDYLRLSQFP